MFKPKFTITPSINSTIAEIEKLKTIVDQARILPGLEVQLRFRATVESVHSSTSIEGNPLNQLEVQKVLQGDTVAAPDYALKEVLNYKQALDWLSKKSTEDGFLSPKQVLELHSLVMKGLLPKQKVGSWRSGAIYVVDEVNGKETIQYSGPDAEKLPKLVESFLRWIQVQQKTKLHPVLLAGLIHYIFVSIHPFSDGNGRTTRLLVSQYLRSVNYNFRDSLSLDGYYLLNRKKYYQALSLGNDFDSRMYADITPFLEFFVDGFLESAQTLSKYIQSEKVVDDQGKPLRLNQEELQLLDYVYKFGSIDLSEAEDILSTTKRTTQRRLMSLVEKQILEIVGKGPATKYILISKTQQEVG
jgi:Fic family protein